MKLKLTLALLAGLLIFTNTKAQTGTPPTPSAIKAAEEMLLVSGTSAQFDKSVQNVINQYSGQIPETNRAAFVQVMTSFLNKYSSWDILKKDLMLMYAREFTEAELKQLTAFYKTPLGIKLNQKQPVLMQTAMTIGQQAVIAHQDELKQMLAEAMK
jgi:hypothetical protein